VIEPKAFEHLNKLKWITFARNNLKSLPYRLFKNNPHIIFLKGYDNHINSINPHFFDGLNNLKMINFENNRCTKSLIECEDCVITQADLKKKFQKCFDNCADDSECNSANLAHGN
jgi:hypothetical protein